MRYPSDIKQPMSGARARLVPTVIEQTHRGERGWDDAEDPAKAIMLYVNSPGGVVSAGLAIYDTIQAWQLRQLVPRQG